MFAEDQTDYSGWMCHNYYALWLCSVVFILDKSKRKSVHASEIIGANCF